MKKIKTIYLLLCLSLSLIFNSCDFGSEEYYTYTTSEAYNETYINWFGDSSRCGVIINDTMLNFDGLKLYFPSNKSTTKAYCETYYLPIKNEKREIVDSVKNCGWYFDIPENDYRVKENSFAILYFMNGNRKVLEDTLYRKKEKITLIDKLPLPKLH